MGLPFDDRRRLSSLAMLKSFVDNHPTLMEARIIITAVVVGEAFEMVTLLQVQKSKGWEVDNYDRVCTVHSLGFSALGAETVIDDLLGVIGAGGVVPALARDLGALARELGEYGVGFRKMASGDPALAFLGGFAEALVQLANQAINGGALDDDQMRGRLASFKAALNRLLGLNVVFPEPDAMPVHYPDLADFALDFPAPAEPVVLAGEPVLLGVPVEHTDDEEPTATAAAAAMGLPMDDYPRLSSLAVLKSFVDSHPVLVDAEIIVTGVVVREASEMVTVLQAQQQSKGWEADNYDRVCTVRWLGISAQAAVWVIDDLVREIGSGGIVPAHASALGRYGVGFRRMASGDPALAFLGGFAEGLVQLANQAINGGALDDDQMRGRLATFKAALNRLLGLNVVFPEPDATPVHYPDLADFALDFPAPAEPVVLAGVPEDTDDEEPTATDEEPATDDEPTSDEEPADGAN